MQLFEKQGENRFRSRIKHCSAALVQKPPRASYPRKSFCRVFARSKPSVVVWFSEGQNRVRTDFSPFSPPYQHTWFVSCKNATKGCRIRLDPMPRPGILSHARKSWPADRSCVLSRHSSTKNRKLARRFPFDRAILLIVQNSKKRHATHCTNSRTPRPCCSCVALLSLA